jgi:hypothetical protein
VDVHIPGHAVGVHVPGHGLDDKCLGFDVHCLLVPGYVADIHIPGYSYLWRRYGCPCTRGHDVDVHVLAMV